MEGKIWWALEGDLCAFLRLGSSGTFGYDDSFCVYCNALDIINFYCYGILSVWLLAYGNRGSPLIVLFNSNTNIPFWVPQGPELTHETLQRTRSTRVRISAMLRCSFSKPEGWMS